MAEQPPAGRPSKVHGSAEKREIQKKKKRKEQPAGSADRASRLMLHQNVRQRAPSSRERNLRRWDVHCTGAPCRTSGGGGEREINKTCHRNARRRKKSRRIILRPTAAQPSFVSRKHAQTNDHDRAHAHAEDCPRGQKGHPTKSNPLSERKIKAAASDPSKSSAAIVKDL